MSTMKLKLCLLALSGAALLGGSQLLAQVQAGARIASGRRGGGICRTLLRGCFEERHSSGTRPPRLAGQTGGRRLDDGLRVCTL
jgi:hypothetical protein